MPAIILPEKWRTTPTYSSRPDGNNKLTQDLTHLWTPIGVVNAVTGDKAARASGSPIGIPEAFWTKDADIYLPLNGTNINLRRPWTMAVLLRTFSGLSGGPKVASVSGVAGGYTGAYDRYINFSGDLVANASVYDGASRIVTHQTDIDHAGKNNVFTVVASASDGYLRIFVDGIPCTTQTATSNNGFNGYSAAAYLNITPNPAGVSNYGLGLIAFADGTAWGIAQAKEFHANPWQLYKKSPRILYFPSAGGGGATIAGDLESLTLSTFGATVGSARAVAAALESLALTTSAARVSSDRAVTASVEAISITTSQARIASDRAVSASTEQLTVTPAAASVALVAGIAAGTEALSVTANPATVALNASIAATLEAITVTGLTATVSTSSNTNISAALESITVTVNPATVSRDSALAAALESLTVTPHAASIAVGQIVAAALESLTLTSYPAGIALDVAIAAQLEQINLTTLAAQVGLGTNVAALTEALTLTPHGATITFAPSVGAQTEHLTLTTFAAVVGATEAALLSPGLEFTIPLSRMGYTIPVSRVHFTIPDEG